MKVLFDGPVPFQFAHGGEQYQIEQTMQALARRDLTIEPLRWWDSSQKSDLVHYFGVPSALMVQMARLQGVPTVATVLLTSNCNHSLRKLSVHGMMRRLALSVPGSGLLARQTNWADYMEVDRFIVGLDVEVNVLHTVYGVPHSKVCKLPLGLDTAFLELPDPSRSEGYLITTGTITDRKRSAELARMAHSAKVPILFVGKAYSADDPYWSEFESLIDGKYVLHQAHVDSREKMIDLLQSARGFVIYSRHENWCLSAHEAVACGLPIMVQDQPWSREVFGNGAHFLLNNSSTENPSRLKKFYDQAPSLSPPDIRIWSWDEVAEQLIGIYEEVLGS